jgi:hypothetical protein
MTKEKNNEIINFQTMKKNTKICNINDLKILYLEVTKDTDDYELIS